MKQLLAIVMLILLLACVPRRVVVLWNDLDKTNREEVGNFIEMFPNHQPAWVCLDSLRWKEACDENSYNSYRRYIDKSKTWLLELGKSKM